MTDKRVELIARALCRELYIGREYTAQALDQIVESNWTSWDRKAIRLLSELDKGNEVVTYQQRVLDAEEEPSIWVLCSAEEAMIRAGSPTYEVRPLYARPGEQKP